MSKRRIRAGRKYSTLRVSAYQCEVDSSGIPIKKGKRVGWPGTYGRLDAHRLQGEIMPKLAEYAAQGWAYPFLITSHQLESRATVDVTPPRDLKFHRRKRQSEQAWLAVVLSPREFRLLSPK